MSKVYFNSYRTGGSDLYVINLHTGALIRLTTYEGYDAYAQLSPDETRIAFHRNVGGENYDVLVMDLARRH